MMPDSALLLVVLVALLGLAASVGIERFLQPRPCWRRPKGAWEAHVGLWCAVQGVLTLLGGRPWCALAGAVALFITLVLVNNVKMRSLREPLLFQDYEFFYDTLTYPRLFLPFFGLKNFLYATAFFLLALGGLYAESAPVNRLAWNGQFGGVLLVLGAAACLLWCACRHDPPICFKPEQDIRALGLLGCLWAYGRAKRIPPDLRSPLDDPALGVGSASRSFQRDSPLPQGASQLCHCTGQLPHLVGILQESFFDPRPLCDGIRPDLLASYDSMCAEAAAHGPLTVSAWGGNTVRTEFAFLTGVAEEAMGAHRFNPYQAVTRGRAVTSLPRLMKKLGYRTVCIHPYWERFYNRDKVFRHFGLDEFIDIRSFAGAGRAGPYIADAEVGKKIVQVLREASCPTFVFAITMESHGPLHLERVQPDADTEFYRQPPPPGCADLSIYLRHLRNADRMLGLLRTGFTALDAPVELCCFGDHVPIMPKVYDILGAPDGTVPYLCWSNRRQAGGSHAATPLPAHRLAPTWLEQIVRSAKTLP